MERLIARLFDVSNLGLDGEIHKDTEGRGLLDRVRSYSCSLKAVEGTFGERWYGTFGER